MGSIMNPAFAPAYVSRLGEVDCRSLYASFTCMYVVLPGRISYPLLELTLTVKSPESLSPLIHQTKHSSSGISFS